MTVKFLLVVEFRRTMATLTRDCLCALDPGWLASQPSSTGALGQRDRERENALREKRETAKAQRKTTKSDYRY